jgi:S1-C subfamily serine protease
VGRDVGNDGGCYVRGVSGRAQAAGIEAGDVIIQIENTKVKDTFDADNLVGQAISGGFADVVIWVIDKNTNETVGVAVPLG